MPPALTGTGVRSIQAPHGVGAGVPVGVGVGAGVGVGVGEVLLTAAKISTRPQP